MNEAQYIAAVHRREQRRAEAIFDLVVMALFAIGYGVYRLCA